MAELQTLKISSVFMPYNRPFKVLALIIAFFALPKHDLCYAQESTQEVYTYNDKSHTVSEIVNQVAAMYAISWPIYVITQPDTVFKDGSVKKYRKNFGRLVFDHDEPFWNWFVHPISGSQLYLYYRALGHKKSHSVALAFLSSALFEFTIEIYTEPASIQDLYQTPVIGSALGLGLESLSMYLLNTGSTAAKIAGHIINPATLFWFYKERNLKIVPIVTGLQKGKAQGGLFVSWRF